MTAKITGEIGTEQGRTRHRGVDEAPLAVDHRGSDSPAAHDRRWDRLEAKWADGPDEDDAFADYWEDAYYDDVIGEDMDFSIFETGAGGYSVAIG